MLVSILHKFNWFDKNYCSKNFVTDTDKLDGFIKQYTGTKQQFYNKFFLNNDSDKFYNEATGFGHLRFNHNQNIKNLESRLTESFIHIVSESVATSYHAFVTEKFLYSVVTRGLFLPCGQPGWQAHLEKYYGFKRYDKLFDYKFDKIQNPIERFVELMSMISKFSVLKPTEWNDLYQIEAETIEYNYDHYFSGQYLKHLHKQLKKEEWIVKNLA